MSQTGDIGFPVATISRVTITCAAAEQRNGRRIGN